jgi:pSer/pThr/pTyr-binding forkhead associated (FHA) protein
MQHESEMSQQSAHVHLGADGWGTVPRMDAQPIGLDVVAGPAAGTIITVENELIVGRLSEGPGRLLGDQEISRSHARLARDAGGVWMIEDLGSTNGTFVNSLRISAPQALELGDAIEVGATTLIVRDPGEVPDVAEQPVEPPVTKPSGVMSVTPGPLTLRLEVDSAAGTATIAWDDTVAPIRLTYTPDGWRIADEEGETVVSEGDAAP